MLYFGINIPQTSEVCRVLFFIILASLFSFPDQCRGEVFFEDDFEQELKSDPSPDWSWQAPYSPGNIFGMMYGPGDIYERSDAKKHSGSFSLRLNLGGRNGVCNTCGSYAQLKQKTGIDSENFFVDGAQSDISALCKQPDPQRSVYNRTDYWSKWEGVSVENHSATNDKLNVNISSGSMGNRGRDRFSSGDEVIFFRSCGIDGSIGGDINRRSDCDLAINYLNGIRSSHHPPGGSIFKRFYFFISEEGAFPNATFKLGYYKATGNQASWTVIIGGDFISGRSGNIMVEGAVPYSEVSNPKITRGEWWYIEEEFRRETSDIANDGEYRLWYGKAGEDPGNPKIERKGLDLRQIETNGSGMSIIGNWQHFNDCTAFVYIDDVKIANERIGQSGGFPDTTPPASPSGLRVR